MSDFTPEELEQIKKAVQEQKERERQQAIQEAINREETKHLLAR